MKFERLGNICQIGSGGTPSRGNSSYFGGSIPWAKISDIEDSKNGIITTTEERITEEGLENIRDRIFSPGTLLFAIYGSIGKTAIAGVSLSTNQAILGILPKDPDTLDIRYLKGWLDSNKQYFIRQGQGVALKNLSAGFVRDIEIPLPPLDDQKRIAHLLGKAEGLIARRKQQLQQLDALLKSVFLEMFGDPVKNEKGWEKKQLVCLGELNRGVSKHRPRNAPELLGGKYPLIQTGEVSNAGTYITSYSHTYSEFGFAQSKMWPAGTLCITIAANIAKTGIITFDACFPDSVVGFTPIAVEANALYVHGLFMFFQKILEKNAPAAAQKNINLEILRTLEVPAPPLVLQNQFAAIVDKVEGIKTRYQQNLADLEALYGVLSQKAFAGELDLSRVELPLVEEKFMNVDAPELRASATPAFAVPPIPEDTNLGDKAQRQALIEKWLEAYLQHLHVGQNVSINDFVDAVNNALQSQEDVAAWGAADHDLVREQIFKALETSRLEQTSPPISDKEWERSIALKKAR